MLKNNNIVYNDIGTGKTILFLHGWGQNKHSFDSTIAYLKNEYRCISLDLPGFGDSPEPYDYHNLDGYKKNVLQLIEDLNIHNPIIIAHSFGARIAFKLMIDNDVSNKIILTGAAGIKPKRNFIYRIKIINYKIKKKLVKTFLYKQYADDLFATSGSDDYKKASIYMKKVLNSVVNENLLNDLSKIDNKVLLFWGKNDDATPIEDAYIINKEIINSNLIITNGSHYAFLEENELFNKEIKKFLRENK